MRKLPVKQIAPDNGKSGFSRTVVPDDKYDAIDWNTKGDTPRDVSVSYPNRIENRCAMAEVTCNKC